MNVIKTCYEMNPYKDLFDFIDVDSVIIPFKKNCKKILIWVSGGADSALLTYLLCKYINDTNLNVEVHILQFIRKWEKAPWQETIAKNIFNYFTNLFPNITFIRHNPLVPTVVENVVFVNKVDALNNIITSNVGGDVIICNENCNFITARNNIEVSYNATTCNPPVSFKYKVKSRDVTCDGTIESSFKLLSKISNLGYYDCNPFIFTDKSWIIKQYRDNNLVRLLNMTRSCESYIKGIDFSNWNGDVSTLEDCNTECFWCQERNWALEVNGLLKYKNRYGKINE